MLGIATEPALLLGIATSISDLGPYLVLAGAGFLVGAWGQEARLPALTALGLALIILGVFLFFIDNGSGPSGMPRP